MRNQRKTKTIPTSVPNEGAMTHLAQGFPISTPPWHEQSGRKGVFNMDSASQSQEPVDARSSSTSRPALEETSAGKSVPMLPQSITSQLPSEEATVAPSTTPPGSPRPSPRLLEIVHNAPTRTTQEQPAAPTSLHLHDDMDIDRNVPVQDLDKTPVEVTSHDSQQEHSQEAVEAYQRHIRNMLLGVTARMNMPTSLLAAPGRARTENGGEGSSTGSRQRRGKGKAEAKGKDDDRAILNRLFNDAR